MSFGDSFESRLAEQAGTNLSHVRTTRNRRPILTLQPEHRYHWADIIVNTTYMNDVMRAVCVIPGLFSLLEWWKTDHIKKNLYRHAEYATEHTAAYLLSSFLM